jgi:hypothetical protein
MLFLTAKDLSNLEDVNVKREAGVYGVATASVSATSNTRLGLYIAKGGSVITNSENYTTAASTNRAENAMSQTVVSLSTNEYIEVFIENDSNSSDITVTDMSVIVEALN